MQTGIPNPGRNPADGKYPDPKLQNLTHTTRIYGLQGINNVPFTSPVHTFNTELGILDEVNVSILGIVSYQTFNPTYPYNMFADYLEIVHNINTIGLGGFGFYPAIVFEPVAFTLPASPMYNQIVSLNITFDNDIPFPIVSSLGYLGPPAIVTGNLDGFKDESNIDLSQIWFNQFVNYPINYVQVYSTLFMQIDYHYTPPPESGPSIIGPIQTDLFTHSLFPGLISIQEISNENLYALVPDPIPEPASLLLLGTGMGALGLVVYRHKRK